jgi:L,D-transpeptidase YbiS
MPRWNPAFLGSVLASDAPRSLPVRPAAEKRVHDLQRDVLGTRPRGPYLLVDVGDNRFELHDASGAVVRSGFCSTGSSKRLTGPDGRTWEFETPRGCRRVLEKTENPVWQRPDWAFVEEGAPIPPPGAPERFEYGVLGSYALGLGDGYYIHGSLYPNDIGRSVTHGCVRLLDGDLAAVYRTLSPGNAVLIF